MFQLQDLEFESDQGEMMNFIIQDVMGLETRKDVGLHKKDIEQLVGGHIRPGYIVRFYNMLLSQ